MILKLAIMVLTIGTTLLADMRDPHAFIVCSTKPCERPSGKRPRPRMSLTNAVDKVTTSSNWCGFVAAPNLINPAPFTTSVVGGSWIVPNIQASAAGDTWCSVWVGIDGAGSPSVEQIGTEHDIRNGVQSHYAWYEMFPLGSQQIVGFPVEVGDQITASVVYVPLSGVLQPNSDLFILQIFNNTKKLYTAIPQISNSRMQRVCAEWIVEAPWLNKTLPLSSFGTVFLFNCSCIINNMAGAINNPSWNYEAMNMVSPEGISKAVASSLSPDGKSFSVSWKHN